MDKSRNPLIVANWKMNNGISDSLKFVASFSSELKVTGRIEVVLCPPFTSLYSTSIAISETHYKLGAQNLHWEDAGAYTGDISSLFLKEIGCSYVIVGHSERRHVFNEPDEWLKKKVVAAQKSEIIPIFCVGEKLEERENKKTWDVIEHQLKAGLSMFERGKTPLAIAYEPVWAIGTGKNATASQAQEVHSQIRDWVGAHFDRALSDEARILYGGSVNPSNSAEIMKQKDIDGFLVGGASLDPKKFADIVRSGF